MRAIHEELLDKSLAAALSSIEIYNKPDFKYREEIFTVLIINAWELMLKAKILKDENEDIKSLYIIDGSGRYKRTRNRNYLTIEINKAMNKVNLDQLVKNNIQTLLEARDSAVHFYSDKPLSYLLYTLGAASLQNYQKLINQWFQKSLNDYNFYILPLGFAYTFEKLSLLELEKEPEAISNLIKSVTGIQDANDSSNDFYFICEITTNIKKKIEYTHNTADLSVAIDPVAKESIQIIREIDPFRQYPLNYRDLCNKIKEECPNAKQQEINKIIKDFKLKDNPNFSYYHFNSQKHKNTYEKTRILPSGITSLYNNDAVRFIIAHLTNKPIDTCII
jgi:Protein of unknown function (DUF3644).